MNRDRCRFFRNKSMCVSGLSAETEDHEESAAAAYCWCNRTMNEIGEDDRLVSSTACADPQRPCYRPL